MLNSLDIEASNAATGKKVLEVAHSLFAAVKNVPLSLRKNFPEILKNNNFGLSVRVTSAQAFLEISPKSKAIPSKDSERADAYQKLFTSIDSGKEAVLRLDGARLNTVAKLGLDGGYGIALGTDVSLCLWDVISLNRYFPKEKGVTRVDLLYIVSYGELIRQDSAVHEFDTLLRWSFAAWHEGN